MLRIQQLINDTYDEEMALINVDDKELIISGDYYHNKIDEYIQGFIHGLKYMDIEFEELPTINVTPADKLFKICEFYDDIYYKG